MKKFSGAEIMKMLVVSAAIVAIFSLVAEADICGVSELGLVACKPAVTAPNPEKPTEGCCSALKMANVTCLCGLKDSPDLKKLGIDVKLAQQLPKKCNLGSAHC